MADKGSRKKMETKLIEKALDDPAFRKKLADDPKGAISKELGIELPPEIEVRVVQETPEILYIVLPSQPEGFAAGRSGSTGTVRAAHAQLTSCDTQDLCRTGAQKM
jgi:hypothetical protein